MLQTLILAIGLVFILEGLLPFLAPRLWRRAMHRMIMQKDKALRTFGFVSMMIGLMIVYLIHLNYL